MRASKYSPEFRERAVRLARESERPISGVARDLGLHPDSLRTWEGWSYLAVVLDVNTRRSVGWQLASHMRQSLVTDALDMALAARQEHEDGLVAHSDNGSQYTSYEYTERIKRAGIAPSRGRSGTALDNAMAESIMSTLKRE